MHFAFCFFEAVLGTFLTSRFQILGIQIPNSCNFLTGLNISMRSLHTTLQQFKCGTLNKINLTGDDESRIQQTLRVTTVVVATVVVGLANDGTS